MFSVTVNVWPSVVGLIDCVPEFTPCVKVTVYVPGGSEKLTKPCEFVTFESPSDGIETFTPCRVVPWLLITLIEIVMLDTGTVTLEEVEVCVVSAVTELYNVDTIVVVAVSTPPNGENRSIVESGVLYP